MIFTRTLTLWVTMLALTLILFVRFVSVWGLSYSPLTPIGMTVIGRLKMATLTVRGATTSFATVRTSTIGLSCTQLRWLWPLLRK